MQNTQIIQKFHFGIYGIVLKDNAILLVRKSRGPYTGKLDLPGGRPEHGESPMETLYREILEETGVRIDIDKTLMFDNLSIVVEYTQDGQAISLHHVGMIYMAHSFDETNLLQETTLEDSLGAEWYQWYPADNVAHEALSPFAQIVINALQKYI